MVAEDGGALAGWYPDPLGLPQLRWWDGGAWTEFTAPAEEPPEDTGDEVADGVSDVAADPVVHVVDLDDGLEGSLERHAPESDGAGDDVDDVDDDDTVVVPRVESFAEQLAVPEPGPGPEPTGALAVVPEPFDPVTVDPFAAAEANAMAFTSRRARRAYERKRALEAGGADPAAPSYADLDTNPVVIQLATPAADPDAAPWTVPDEPLAASQFEPPVPPTIPASPAAPAAPGPEAPTAGTPLDGREDILAQSALAPRDGTDPAFSLESTGVAEELPPARTLIPKRTVGALATVLALLPALALLGIVLLRYVPELTVTSLLAAGIGAAAYVIGLLLALLDASALRRWGHERTASPLWALLTPMVYLTMRSIATRRETGRDGGVVLAWILGLVLAAAVVALFPDLVPLLMPGLTAPWSSPLS
ncbi:MAG TPA: DUF2510 domain-containing protein [Microbacteriaceae bacterium]|nr:DUF2510 domain-containing protein [Microbacteriaceae bacterium]